MKIFCLTRSVVKCIPKDTAKRFFTASQYGFTLIELLVTIAILAIIAVMAAPNMTAMIASQRVDRVAYDLANVLGEARSQAVMLRKKVTVELNQSGTATSTTFYWAPSHGVYKTTSITKIVFGSTGRLIPLADVSLKVCNPDQSIGQEIAIDQSNGAVTVLKQGAC